MGYADKIIKKIRKPLSKVLQLIRAGTSYLTPKDDWVEALRKRIAVALDPFLRPFGRPLIREKGREDYVMTVDMHHDEVEVVLDEMYNRNVTSTRKYRVVDGERQWSKTSYVYDPSNTDWQHHVYAFANGDGTTDLYAHRETSVRDPYGHVTDEMTHGDPDGLLKDLFEPA